MKSTLMRCCMLFLMLAIATAVFAQGFYTESKTSGGALGDRELLSKSFYMPKMIKVINGGENNAMIFRMDKQMIFEVNAEEKTYSETSFAEWEARMKKLQSTMDSQSSELRKKLDEMPEEQRKMVEKMMGSKATGKKESKIDVVASGEKKTIAGMSATKFVVTDDGKETMTVWATKDLKGFEVLRKDYEEYSQKLMAGNSSAMSGLADAMKKIGGFPLAIEFGDAMKMEVTKAEQSGISLKEFEVPPGFTKVKSKFAQEVDGQ